MIDLSKTYAAFALYATEPVLTEKNGGEVEIYELAAVKIKDGKPAELFSTFIDAGKGGEEFLFFGTGVFPEHMTGAPNPSEAFARFKDFIGDGYLFPPNPSVAKLLKHVAKRHGEEIKNKVIRSYLFGDIYRDAMLCPWESFADMKGELGYTDMRDDAFGIAIVYAKLFIDAAVYANGDDEQFFVNESG